MRKRRTDLRTPYNTVEKLEAKLEDLYTLFKPAMQTAPGDVSLKDLGQLRHEQALVSQAGTGVGYRAFPVCRLLGFRQS